MHSHRMVLPTRGTISVRMGRPVRGGRGVSVLARARRLARAFVSPGRVVASACLLFLGLAFLVSPGRAENDVDISLAADPAYYAGSCPVNIKLIAAITAAKPGRIYYRLVRNDGTPEHYGYHVRSIDFEKAGQKDVVIPLNARRSYRGWLSVKVVYPQEVESNRIYLKTDCSSVQLRDSAGAGERFFQELLSGLSGTTLQVSHTGGGQPLYGQPFPVWHRSIDIPARKESGPEAKGPMENLALEECATKYRGDGKRREACEAAVRKRFEGEWKLVKPVYQSYIKFSEDLKRQNKGLEDKALDVPIAERPLPRKAQAALALLSGGIYSTDRVRIFVNSLNAAINSSTTTVRVADGMIKVSVRLSSNQPTLLCDGHAEWFLGLFDDWGDGYCPDPDLQNMTVDLLFTPCATLDGKLSYSDVKVVFSSDLASNAAEELQEVFASWKADLKDAIESELRSKLLVEEVKSALTSVFTASMKKEFGRDRLKGVSCKGHGCTLTFQDAGGEAAKEKAKQKAAGTFSSPTANFSAAETPGQAEK